MTTNVIKGKYWIVIIGVRKLTTDTGDDKAEASFGNLILIILIIKKFCCFPVNILMDYGHDP